MESQYNGRQTPSLCVPARAVFLAAMILVVIVPSPCQSQTVPRDADVGAIATSRAAILPGSKLQGLPSLSPDQPSASEDSSSVATIPIVVRSPHPSLIVVGFAGGFIRRTSSVHGEVELAEHLRERYGSRIHAEVFENHHGNEACREILRLVGASNSAEPEATKRAARIILYGHSWGASEAVAVARQLERNGVPVLLVVEVDGVAKRRHDDGVIPANVAQAINFYQSDGVLHGRRMIYAANPATTKIIGNFRLTYKDGGIPCPGYPWYTRVFTKPHIEIENDPRVWNRVEALILSKATP
jgi:hypothetical protein